jgi:methionyl-tRNA synthetase
LEEWVETASVKGFWANNAVQMTYGWIKSGLRERAITRDLKWGIPVPKPGYEGKVFYVWFDACIGYISITGNYGAESSNDWAAFTNGWWKNPGEVELFQFIGKDNIPFHTVIFPASLLGTGGRWTMLHHLSSTEYLNYEGGKFSKSKGVGVFGTDVMAAGIGPDVWRFYIFYNRPEKADALFAWKDFQEKVNGELIGNLGNLVNRTLTFIVRYYNGKIPGQRLNLSHDSVGPFWERVRKYEADITEKLERAELRDAFRSVFELSSFANKAFQDGEPWKKRREAPHEAELLIRNLAYVVRDLAVLIAPFMPAAAERILSFFGLSLGKKNALGIWSRAQAKDISWDILGQDRGLQEVVKTEVLFPKLEDPLIDALRERYSGGPQDRDDTAARFQRLLDIRAARIVKVERHPKADKLYIETLEIAGEERVIVSGLAPYYTEAELLNKRILVVYNLKSAKIRGVESRGMLLAASASGEDGAELVEALDAGDAPTGARAQIDIGPGGLEPAGEGPKAEISIDEFFSLPLEVRGHTVFAGGRALTLLGKAVRTKRIGEGKVR